MTKQYNFSASTVTCLFNVSLAELLAESQNEHSILITDEHVLNAHKELFEGRQCITVPAGECSKSQQQVDEIILELLQSGTGKDAKIIGIGGGVVTDIAGYTASIFKRGIALSLAPSSILAMTDAAVGGKNGVNAGNFKNMVGTIFQPQEIIYDLSLLKTLPANEWSSGFAEIIKHACIRDVEMFEELEKNNLQFYRNDIHALNNLIQRNVQIKMEIVTNDEREDGNRRLLNFGHTIGHAIEQVHGIAHGEAVSLGMMYAARISEEMNNFYSEDVHRLKNLLQQYNLPVEMKTDRDAVWNKLLADKKRKGDDMQFVLLNKIGNGVVNNISLTQLKDIYYSFG